MFSMTFAADTFSDIESETITYTYSLNPIRTWLTFDPASRTFSGTPANGDDINYVVTVLANDPWTDTTQASDSFTFSIAHNEDPIVANPIPDVASSVAGFPWQFNIPTNTFSEPEGEALWYVHEVTPDAPWLTFDNSTMQLSGTVTDNTYAANYTVTIKAHDPWDDTDFGTDSFDFEITPNIEPTTASIPSGYYSRVPNATSWSFGATFTTDPES